MPNSQPIDFVVIWLNANHQVEKIVAKDMNKEFVAETVTGGVPWPNTVVLKFRHIEDLVGKHNFDVYLHDGNMVVNIGPQDMPNSSQIEPFSMDGEAEYLGLSGEWRDLPWE
ncbi:hypothetical protein FRC09_009903 [Ceratobasidium sp. 395]|nr:hypothetical protein FRC09_009903 [Ceratobasidium sp. 395]